jgi:hypothetical protein
LFSSLESVLKIQINHLKSKTKFHSRATGNSWAGRIQPVGLMFEKTWVNAWKQIKTRKFSVLLKNTGHIFASTLTTFYQLYTSLVCCDKTIIATDKFEDSLEEWVALHYKLISDMFGITEDNHEEFQLENWPPSLDSISESYNTNKV